MRAVKPTLAARVREGPREVARHESGKTRPKRVAASVAEGAFFRATVSGPERIPCRERGVVKLARAGRRLADNGVGANVTDLSPVSNRAHMNCLGACS